MPDKKKRGRKEWACLGCGATVTMSSQPQDECGYCGFDEWDQVEERGTRIMVVGVSAEFPEPSTARAGENSIDRG